MSCIQKKEKHASLKAIRFSRRLINAKKKTQNQCETQHMALFFQFLIQNRLSSAMKNKEWRKIARKYNGPDYAKNDYHTKMKAAYEKLKKNWK